MDSYSTLSVAYSFESLFDEYSRLIQKDDAEYVVFFTKQKS